MSRPFLIIVPDEAQKDRTRDIIGGFAGIKRFTKTGMLTTNDGISIHIVVDSNHLDEDLGKRTYRGYKLLNCYDARLTRIVHEHLVGWSQLALLDSFIQNNLPYLV